MIYAAEEPKITRKLLLTFKITIWQKFLHVNAQFLIEVETLNWTCVTSTSFMLLRWISKHTTMLMTCCINSDLENWQRRNPLNLKESRAKRLKPQLPPDLTLVLFSFQWQLVLLTWHTEETTLILWTISLSTSSPDPSPILKTFWKLKKRTRIRAPQPKLRLRCFNSKITGNNSSFKKQLNNLLLTTQRLWRLTNNWDKLEASEQPLRKLWVRKNLME